LVRANDLDVPHILSNLTDSPFARPIAGILWLVFKRAQTVSYGENLLGLVTVVGEFHSEVRKWQLKLKHPVPE
jgi:hypothetical protein